MFSVISLKCPRTGVSTEGGEATAASWKWYSLMDEAIGGRPSVTPPVLIASSSQDVAVVEPPSVVTPERDTARASTASTPKRRRVDVVEALKELQERELMQEQEMKRMEERAREREEARDEREERWHREAVEREERRFAEMRERDERRDKEMREREERRDREVGMREERFLSLLEKLVNK